MEAIIASCSAVLDDKIVVKQVCEYKLFAVLAHEQMIHEDMKSFLFHSVSDMHMTYACTKTLSPLVPRC